MIYRVTKVRSGALLIGLTALIMTGIGLHPYTSGKARAQQTVLRPQATAGPVPMRVPKLSGRIPLVIPAHDPGTPEQARPYFDLFSWESFIALNWPVAPGQRGIAMDPDQPQVFLKMKQGDPTVWGSYKEAYELFGQGENRPTPWPSYVVPVSPYPNAPPGVRILGIVNTPVDQAFSYPLVDQHGNFVTYEVRFNETQYDFVRGVDTDPSSWLYLLKNQPAKKPMQMPSSVSPSTQGALMIKASWRILTSKDNSSHFYVSRAYVYNPITKKYSLVQIGLVGLHIVQKLKDFPEWIWSSFEQRENVPDGPVPSPGIHYSFNNGTQSPPTTDGYANRPPAQAQGLPPDWKPIPVQVVRVNPIPTTPSGMSTQDINRAYQKALRGTVWEHYQLVITQWPSGPGNFTTVENGGVYPQDCGAAFPVNGAVNTSMETYIQSTNQAAGSGGNSCMSCHYRAGQTDFSWSLARRAH